MESLSLKRATAVWIVTVLLLFVIVVTLGIIMRLNQGEVIHITPVTFYTHMTTHGLTMAGIWFVAGMAAINYLLQRYVQTSLKANLFAMILTVIGVVMLWTTTFIGKFHTGWYFLYPLPFTMTLTKWAPVLFLLSLTVLGVGWFVWSLSLVIAILKKYSLSQAFAWQHFKKNPVVETPPFVLISFVSLAGTVICLVAAVLLLILYFAEYLSGGEFVNDALLMKNLTFFFGHTLVNEMLYFGVACLYELFPEISGRPKFKNNWYVALAWNCTFVFILTAFSHHLYMDFVQPKLFQIISMTASYLASIPAAGVTAFTVLAMVYKSPVQWKLSNLLFFTGVAGWIIGGVGAVIDATISNNFILHNTQWVPAHFHTYNALGNVLFSLAFFHWFATTQASTAAETLSSLKLWLIVLGGTGFVLMFYLAGAESIPRRFSNYPELFTSGPLLARIAAAFASVYLLAILLFLFDITKRCLGLFGKQPAAG